METLELLEMGALESLGGTENVRSMRRGGDGVGSWREGKSGPSYGLSVTEERLAEGGFL